MAGEKGRFSCALNVAFPKQLFADPFNRLPQPGGRLLDLFFLREPQRNGDPTRHPLLIRLITIRDTAGKQPGPHACQIVILDFDPVLEHLACFAPKSLVQHFDYIKVEDRLIEAEVVTSRPTDTLAFLARDYRVRYHRKS